MNRITATFNALKAQGRKGLVGYLTAGDPDVGVSEQDIRTALDHGVDVLELGVPFSDPTADGPTIQAAAHRALASGMTFDGVLALVRRLRRDYETPIVLFGYANPLFHCGFDDACRQAAEAGADGMLVVDLPLEEMDELGAAMTANELCLVPLVAPTTPPERAATIAARANGFVYYVMFRGVTGARAEVADDLAANVEALRAGTSLPVAVGFGVSDGHQAAEVGRHADAVVVGSALIKAARAGKLAQT